MTKNGFLTLNINTTDKNNQSGISSQLLSSKSLSGLPPSLGPSCSPCLFLDLLLRGEDASYFASIFPT